MILIRARAAEDNAQLAEIWLRSVRATHHFLNEDDIARLFPLVLNHYLPAVSVWVVEDRPGQPLPAAAYEVGKALNHTAHRPGNGRFPAAFPRIANIANKNK
ncbi:putative acetyltransferase [Serratia entomophila]|nr:putative acetyltransferase [Serratia entomophila]CAI0904776.1 putative acetyltransferase [Serratia entomophila]CAI0909533.1 putative acetyltransferase [Serratia entomophila]CAI0988107.1 putative acetyltransferase [Serratia entomophila]CAI1591881.1 putative acetyltransferase [Serratia entomophila]